MTKTEQAGGLTVEEAVKCSKCQRTATRQTVKGDWYCTRCWNIGDQMEKDAMYGSEVLSV